MQGDYMERCGKIILFIPPQVGELKYTCKCITYLLLFDPNVNENLSISHVYGSWMDAVGKLTSMQIALINIYSVKFGI